jgi:hypothetical protein
LPAAVLAAELVIVIGVVVELYASDNDTDPFVAFAATFGVFIRIGFAQFAPIPVVPLAVITIEEVGDAFDVTTPPGSVSDCSMFPPAISVIALCPAAPFVSVMFPHIVRSPAEVKLMLSAAVIPPNDPAFVILTLNGTPDPPTHPVTVFMNTFTAPVFPLKFASPVIVPLFVPTPPAKFTFIFPFGAVIDVGSKFTTGAVIFTPAAIVAFSVLTPVGVVMSNPPPVTVAFPFIAILPLDVLNTTRLLPAAFRLPPFVIVRS